MQVESDPDSDWVAELSGRGAEESQHALAEAAGERRLFSQLARSHARAGRTSYVEIDAPLELHALVRLLRPAHVVEVGVSSGVSSAYMLKALEQNGEGRLHSIDLPAFPPKRQTGKSDSRISWTLPPGRSSGWAVPVPLRKRWDLRLGDKRDVLPILAEQLPSIDLLIYDVPHEDNATRREFQALDPLFPPGAVAIVDHGPGGGRCDALGKWARAWNTRPVGRQGLGLYGARRPRVVAKE
jgi:Methyltransferase domain